MFDTTLRNMELNQAVDAYLACALWTDGFTGCCVSEFDTVTVDSAKEDCDAFYDVCGDLLIKLAPETWGRLFWLSRNGHGTGFFDCTEVDESTGWKLQQLARSCGEKMVSRHEGILTID
jgi:hypothetical protein